ncbi:MAG: hypothetical protein II767_01420, partial [Proteobacteria bacterium]|nr:hypothetical protein [Pseudomonadota bacterium]
MSSQKFLLVLFSLIFLQACTETPGVETSSECQPFEDCANPNPPVPPTPVCTNSTLKCTDDNTQALICLNNQWIIKETCSNGCANGICINDIPVQSCTSGELKCSS